MEHANLIYRGPELTKSIEPFRHDPQMRNHYLRLAPALFLATGFCFLLPFVDFSNRQDGQRDERLSGVQLVLGATLKHPQLYDLPTRIIEPDGYATIAVLSAVIGFALSLFPGVRNLLATVVVAVFGGASLLFMQAELDHRFAADPNVILVSFEPAFAMALFLFIIAAGSGLLCAWSWHLRRIRADFLESAHSCAKRQRSLAILLYRRRRLWSRRRSSGQRHSP